MAAREHPLFVIPRPRSRPAHGRAALTLAYGVGAYAAVGAGAAGMTAALGRDPLTCDGWLGATGVSAALLSLGLGVSIAAVTISASRALVHRAAWARALHEGLRPAVHRAGDATLLALAVASGAAAACSCRSRASSRRRCSSARSTRFAGGRAGAGWRGRP
jgi:hypothetical protein